MDNKINYRRVRLYLNTPAEASITNAIREIEKLGGSPELTEAIILLSKTKDIIGDYIDKMLEENQFYKF